VGFAKIFFVCNFNLVNCFWLHITVGLGVGLDVLTFSPGTAAEKSCLVEGNKKKLIDACPALNKSSVKLPLLVQDNVLPA